MRITLAMAILRTVRAAQAVNASQRGRTVVQRPIMPADDDQDEAIWPPDLRITRLPTRR